MSGWEGSTRRLRLPDDWAERRHYVMVRDGYRCQVPMPNGICGWKATDVDHIERGDNHDPTNLRAICQYHHRIKSSSEGGQAYWDKRKAAVERFRKGRLVD